MDEIDERITGILDEAGWDDESVVTLLYRFIASQGLVNKLRTFLKDAASDDGFLYDDDGDEDELIDEEDGAD